MNILHTIPQEDGFRMPAEYEKHRGTMLTWPVRPGSWVNRGADAKKTFTEIANELAKHEEVYILCSEEYLAEVQTVFAEKSNIFPMVIDTDDAWSRDIGPTCVVNDKGEVRGIDWSFNAWGGTYDGLYASWDKDDAAAGKLCEKLEMDCYDAKHFVLEGGSIHSDGEGTVLVTESCLLSPGRNPQMSKQQIEDELKKYLGAKKVIWLPRGIEGDETNEHVDNACAFVGPAEVVLAWTDDADDIQYGPSNESLKTLMNETDAKGRHFCIHKLPIPKKPVCITEEELAGLEFEDGEDTREPGERLAASYVNYYVANGCVLVPQFGDVNDKQAIDILAEIFPDREIVGIQARSIIVGGGNIHCITQQIPAGNRE